MRLKSIEEALYVILAANAMFLLGMFIGDPESVFALMRSARTRHVGTPSETSRLVAGIARLHPDPAVSGPFASKLESGEVEAETRISEGGELASIGPNRGTYLLTIEPSLVKSGLSKEEMEGAFMVLSHEHRHFRQFEGGWMTPSDHMTDTQCSMLVLSEVDAYAKTCRDAIRYGWNGTWKDDFCGRTTAQIAESLFRRKKQFFPECVENWKFFARLQAD